MTGSQSLNLQQVYSGILTSSEMLSSYRSGLTKQARLYIHMKEVTVVQLLLLS